MKLLNLGKIALDGTKTKANASKHKALSYAYAQKIEVQLREEVKALTAQAEAANSVPVADGLDIPEEIARRKDRLQVLAAAQITLQVLA